MPFVVTRTPGPAWDRSRPMKEQAAWAEHAAFMNGLADSGFVMLGGPVGNGDKILLIVEADSEDAIRTRLDADPWTPMQLLQIAVIERWTILLGDSTQDPT
jgi:uncharacterized protein YciI